MELNKSDDYMINKDYLDCQEGWNNNKTTQIEKA